MFPPRKSKAFARTRCRGEWNNAKVVGDAFWTVPTIRGRSRTAFQWENDSWFNAKAPCLKTLLHEPRSNRTVNFIVRFARRQVYVTREEGCVPGGRGVR